MNLLFLTPALERQFARLVDSQHEVGGYLITTGRTQPGLDRRKIKSAFGLGRGGGIDYITSWIIIPNVSKKSRIEWRGIIEPSIGKHIAQTTCHSIGATDTLHFHTHPRPSTNKPSKADLRFWTECCVDFSGKASRYCSGAIVTADFEWGIYQMTVNTSKMPYTYTLEQDRFLSWFCPAGWKAANVTNWSDVGRRIA